VPLSDPRTRGRAHVPTLFIPGCSSQSGKLTAMKPWPSPGISSIESDCSDMARTAVHHAMSELAHSEIPVHCEIAAITI